MASRGVRASAKQAPGEGGGDAEQRQPAPARAGRDDARDQAGALRRRRARHCESADRSRLSDATRKFPERDDRLARLEPREHLVELAVAGADLDVARRQPSLAEVDEDDPPRPGVDHRRGGHQQLLAALDPQVDVRVHVGQQPVARDSRARCGSVRCASRDRGSGTRTRRCPRSSRRGAKAGSRARAARRKPARDRSPGPRRRSRPGRAERSGRAARRARPRRPGRRSSGSRSRSRASGSAAPPAARRAARSRRCPRSRRSRARAACARRAPARRRGRRRRPLAEEPWLFSAWSSSCCVA